MKEKDTEQLIPQISLESTNINRDDLSTRENSRVITENSNDTPNNNIKEAFILLTMQLKNIKYLNEKQNKILERANKVVELVKKQVENRDIIGTLSFDGMVWREDFDNITS